MARPPQGLCDSLAPLSTGSIAPRFAHLQLLRVSHSRRSRTLVSALVLIAGAVAISGAVSAMSPQQAGASLNIGRAARPRVPAQAQTGVYTKEQAERGHKLYDEVCASCHGLKLQGETSPALTGPTFAASWGRPELSLDDFYYVVRKTMPKEGAGTMSRQEYADVVAYILQQNGFASGDAELTPDPVVMKAVRFPAAAPPPPLSR